MSLEIDRRELLRLAAASAAMAAASGCKRAPSEKIVPYVVQPPEVVPGEALHFATATTIDGYALGLLAESHEGRPTKLRGNPDHPASLGANRALAEATVLSLYDPDRANVVLHREAPSTWADAREVIAKAGAEGGRGLHLLLEPTTSPTIADQIARLRAKLPEIDVRWHAPLTTRNAWDGATMALGAPYEARLDLARADVVLALDADFLVEGPAALVHARAFAGRRTPHAPSDGMSRAYAVEPTPSCTGLAADHRLRVRPSDVTALAAAIALALGISIDGLGPWAARVKAHDAWIQAVARDLADHRGASLVVVGEPCAPEVHALGHAINAALDNVGRTIAYARSPIVDAGTDAFDLAPLALALDAGAVRALLVLGGNPVYDAPADLRLAERFPRAQTSLHLGAYRNETALACEWLVPKAHALESWADASAFDGTVSIVQPLIAPMESARTTAEIVSALLGEPPQSAHDLLLARWRASARDLDRWLERGVAPSTAIPHAPAPALRSAAISSGFARMQLPPPAADAIEIAVRPDPKIRDGALANSPWLQEMPASPSSIVWDNAAFISRATAARLGVHDGDELELQTNGRSVRAPAKILHGQADDAITVTLGYGRRGAESIARGLGFDAYALQTQGALWTIHDASVRATGARHEFARYQEHDRLEDRAEHIALYRDLATWARDPAFAAAKNAKKLTLYDDTPHPGPGRGEQWGMTVDLAACTGCGACTIACQAENNVPSVGKGSVAKGRAMHWLVIDRYVLGDESDESAALFQPMLCQHCEKAPCEYVCPVNATTHSADGLNQMAYNRCVGTRFCSNNCPYKVRRFNWFDFHASEAPSIARVHNPDVTVRARGVIEKCTMCVQRIREAQIRSRTSGAPIVDGDLATACEEACPSRVITFGDLSDPSSRVSRTRTSGRVFACLSDLGTEPRVRYLARIRNPNPALTSPASAK